MTGWQGLRECYLGLQWKGLLDEMPRWQVDARLGHVLAVGL